MNWYKIAITKKQFYEFYALQGLPDSVFKNHPEVLFEFIEELNYIRGYYLDNLFQKLAQEFSYFRPPADDSKSRIRYKEDSNLLRIKRDYEKASIIVKKLYKCIAQRCSVSSSDVQTIIRCFEQYSWFRSFGGATWANITKWIFELYNFGELKHEKYNAGLMQKVRKLVMLIDVIHSLEHNTSLVLVDLPGGERQWLDFALDIVRDIKNPVMLADLAKNTNISKLYRREVFPLQGGMLDVRVDRSSLQRDYLSGLDIVKYERLARFSSDYDILNILSTQKGIYVLLDLCSNKYTAQYVDIVKNIYRRVNAMSQNWDVIDGHLKYIANSPLISKETVDYLASILRDRGTFHGTRRNLVNNPQASKYFHYEEDENNELV